MEIYKSLPNHKNLVQFFDGTIRNTNMGAQALFLMEFCGDGTIFDMMATHEKTKLTEKTVLDVLF